MMKLGKSQRDKQETEVASVACFNAEGKLLFLQRRDNGKWTLPGGHLEPGEKPERAAIRELLEEAGLTPESKSFESLGDDVVTSFTGKRLRVHAFRCNMSPGQEPSYEQDPDAEAQDHEWADPEFLPKYILENLHSPKNVTLRLLGLQDWDESVPAEGSKLPEFQPPHLQMQPQPILHPTTKNETALGKGGYASKLWPSPGNKEGRGDISDETWGHASDWVNFQDKDARDELAHEGMEKVERAPAIELEHYSPMRGLKSIDPSMQGTGAFGLHGAETQRTSRIPRSYYYTAGSKPEATFQSGEMQKYRVRLPAKAKLYDISADPENLFAPKHRRGSEGETYYQPPDLDAIERQIRKRGYHGYKNYHPSIPNAVAVFYPMKPLPVAKSEQDQEPTQDLGKTDVEVLMQHPSRAERMMALKLPGVTTVDLRRGVEDPDAQVALAALRHPLVNEEVLTQALAHPAPNVRIAAAAHPRCDATHLQQALADVNPLVRRALATSKNLGPEHIQELLAGGDPEVLEGLASNPNLSPAQAVAILVNPGVSAETKALVAASPHVPEELRAQVQPQLQLQAQLQRSADEWVRARKAGEEFMLADPLGKSHPTPTFPKMGLGDNPRETPIINIPRELNTKAAAFGQKRKNFSGDAQAAARERALVLKNPGNGMTYTGPGSGTGETNIAYSLSSGMRQGIRPEAPGSLGHIMASNPMAGEATKLHEDLHQMFNRVQAQAGPMGRKIFAHNLYYSMPSEARAHVTDFTTARDPNTRVWADRTGRIQTEHDYPFEERMALMLNYLNNPGERVAYHKHMGHSPEDARFIGTAIKRAYQHLLAAAQTAPSSWTQAIQPWGERLGKAEPHRNGMPGAIDTEDQHQPHEEPESVSREAAHQTGGRDDDKHVMADADPDFVADFEGHDLDEDAAFAAAMFLAGKPRLPREEMRRFVWEEDGDVVAAALRAYGMEPDAAHREALSGVLLASGLEKVDAHAVAGGHDEAFEEGQRPDPKTDVQALTPEAEPVAQAVQRAFRNSGVEPIALKGKHTRGTMVAHDEKSGDAWLLKPGSGAPSPAKGIAETQGSQSAREACFYACAEHVFGLQDSIPETRLLSLNGKPVAAMRFLPPEFRSLEARSKEDSFHVLWSLHSYLKCGLLHKWAVLDGVLGQIDRHGKNILANNSQPERMYLIDHGSSFAGDAFDPGHDKSSFIPYYLRAWSPRKFNTLSPEEKLRRMPRADQHVEVLLRDWVASLHADALEQVCARFGLDPGPSLRRLAKLKAAMREGEPVDQTINRMWAGLESWETEAPPAVHV